MAFSSEQRLEFIKGHGLSLYLRPIHFSSCDFRCLHKCPVAIFLFCNRPFAQLWPGHNVWASPAGSDCDVWVSHLRFSFSSALELF